MSESKSKILLKSSSIHLEFEGNLSDLKENLSDFLEVMSEFQDNTPQKNIYFNEDVDQLKAVNQNDISLSTNTIATRISAKSCSNVALAAIMNLHFVQTKETFSYKDILDEMKKAHSFYKPSMKGSNLKNALDTLVKDKKINECGSKVYALHSSVISDLEAQLAAA